MDSYLKDFNKDMNQDVIQYKRCEAEIVETIECSIIFGMAASCQSSPEDF